MHISSNCVNNVSAREGLLDFVLFGPNTPGSMSKPAAAASQSGVKHSVNASTGPLLDGPDMPASGQRSQFVDLDDQVVDTYQHAKPANAKTKGTSRVESSESDADVDAVEDMTAEDSSGAVVYVQYTVSAAQASSGVLPVGHEFLFLGTAR